MTEPNSEHKEPKPFWNRTRVIILVTGLVILLFLVLFGKNFVQIDTRWFILFGLIAGVYVIVQQYWKKHSKENLYQMLDKIRNKEYKERGTTLNIDIENIQAKPIGENQTYVYFRQEAIGYYYDHVLNAPIGQLPRDILSVEKGLRNDEIAKLILTGKIQAQKEVITE